MKILPFFMSALALLGFSTLGLAEDSYSVFKVCEDQHIIRTSDGAEAGHIEYIVTDPADGRIVSSIVSGGTIGEKMIIVPYASMRFGAQREVTLTEITRERLVSAPVIERNQINVAVRFEPTLVERSFTHFGVRRDSVRTSATTRVEGRDGVQGRDVAPGAAERREGDRERSSTSTSATVRERESGTAREEAQPGRDGNRPRAEAPRDGDRNRPDAQREGNRPGAETPREGDRPKAQGERNTDRAPGEKGRDSGRPGDAATDKENDRKPGETPRAESRNGKNAPDAVKGTAETAREGANTARSAAQQGKDAAAKTAESAEKTGAKAAATTGHAAEKSAEGAREAAARTGHAAERAADKPSADKPSGASEESKPGAEKKTRRPAGEPESKPKDDRPGQ